MFGDINKVELMGNLTADPELRQTNSGTAVCSFSIATNRRYLSNDEWKEDTQFHNIVLWAKRAESFVKFAKKGTRIYVEGRLQTRSWEGDDGNKRYTTEIVGDRVILIDRYEKANTGENSSQQSSPPPQSSEGQSQGAGGSSSKGATKTKEEKIDPDDLPF